MTDDRERWALILGASSGMGEATALALAAGRLQDRRDPSRFPGGARARRGGQGRDRGGRQRGALHQHERRRRREAGRRARDAPRALRPSPRPRAGSRTSGSSCTRSRSARSCRSSPTTRRTAVDRKKMEMTQDVMAQQPRLLGPGPVSRRLPRAGLEDLRDDVRGIDPGRPVVRRRLAAKAALESHVRQLAMELARSGTGIDGELRSGPASPTRRRCARSPSADG